jgi:hypothetical protein
MQALPNLIDPRLLPNLFLKSIKEVVLNNGSNFLPIFQKHVEDLKLLSFIWLISINTHHSRTKKSFKC